MDEYTNNDKETKEAFSPSLFPGGKTSVSPPGPEVAAITRRRRFGRDYKLRILKELEACKIPGGRGLILRREGLFSSQISQMEKGYGKF